jgi:chromosome segregation ATPase
LSAAAEKYETLQGTHQDLNGQLSALQNDHTAVTVKLKFAINENESLQSRLAELAVGYDEAKDQLAEARAKLTAYQDALHAPERKRDSEIS